MAYMNQERKNRIAGLLKEALKSEGIKYTLSVRNLSTIVMKISAAPIDFIRNSRETRKVTPRFDVYGVPIVDTREYLDVNPHWVLSEAFSGKALEVMEKILKALNDGNWDRSDSQSDYFDVGWYIDIKVGDWNKPFKVLA